MRPSCRAATAASSCAKASSNDNVSILDNPFLHSMGIQPHDYLRALLIILLNCCLYLSVCYLYGEFVTCSDVLDAGDNMLIACTSNDGVSAGEGRHREA